MDEFDSEIRLTVVIHKSNGEVVKVSKYSTTEEDVRNLYIAPLDISLHGSYVGTSPDGLHNRKFYFNLRRDEEHLFKSIINDFIENDWFISFDGGFESY